MIKIASFLLSAVIAASASEVVDIKTENRYTGITTSEYGNIIFIDGLDLLDENEEKNVYISLVDAVKTKDISIGVVSAENTDDSTAQEIFNMISDIESDFALMLFNENNYSYYFYGAAEAEFTDDTDAFWMTDAYMSDKHYFIGGVQFALDIQYHTISEEIYTEPTEEPETSAPYYPDEYFTQFPDNGIHTVTLENGRIALLHDLDDSLTVNEEMQVVNDLFSAVRSTDFSICILITDDIGTDKSDYGVMDFTDLYYEKYCGMDTDGVILLINNDNKYDWLSASGRCMNIFGGNEDDVFDSIYDHIVSGNYSLACQGFVQKAKSMGYQLQSDYNDNYYDDNIYEGEFHFNSEDFESLFSMLLFSGLGALIAVAIFGAVVDNNYKMRKNIDAANYKLQNSLVLTQNTDTYLRTYTTRRTVSSSSGSSSRSGGSRSRSSSHRSSSGGRHSGGGRRR